MEKSSRQPRQYSLQSQRAARRRADDNGFNRAAAYLFRCNFDNDGLSHRRAVFFASVSLL